MIILTEKPSVAKDIAHALNYKFLNGVWTSPSGLDCIISARGHLLESYLPNDYDPKWKDWQQTVSELPFIPEPVKYKIKEKTSEVLKQIKSCFEKFNSNEFILATDAEREGEVIGAEILQYVNFTHYNTAKRFWVSEALTPEVVKKGLAEAKPLSYYESYKNAGFARSEADWLIGMNISRILSVQANKLLTFGRVQTAILGAIYLRDRNISQFVSKDYYQLICSLSKNNTSFNLVFNHEENDKFDDKSFLETISKNIKDTLIIKNIIKENKTDNVPQLFNITGLQKYCSNKYHLTPDETLEIAQKLYEEYKCLSYPRTPSIVLGDENVELFKQKFDLLSNKYPELSKKCDISKITSDNKRIFNSKNLSDHHALIPLNFLPDTANEKERNVYNAVILRFFQVVMKPCIYQAITIEAYQDNYKFIGKGRCYIDKGWKENIEADDTSEEVELFPSNIENGEVLPVIKKEIVAKKTLPKKHFTNATILALMENPREEDIEKTGKLVGLGTPATRASIIKELLTRGYVQQKGQQLLITDLGKFLIETVIQIPSLKNFISLSTTTKWEELLTSQPDVFLKEIKTFLKNEIPQIKVNKKWVGDSIGICPLCNKGQINEGNKAYYCSEYKSGCNFSVWKNICGANITILDVKTLLTGNVTKTKKMHSQKTGKDFNAKLKLNKTNNEIKIEYIFDK